MWIACLPSCRVGQIQTYMCTRGAATATNQTYMCTRSAATAANQTYMRTRGAATAAIPAERPPRCKVVYGGGHVYIGLAKTIYIRCVYGNFFGREITKYTVIYGAYKWFWPTLGIHAA